MKIAKHMRKWRLYRWWKATISLQPRVETEVSAELAQALVFPVEMINDILIFLVSGLLLSKG